MVKQYNHFLKLGVLILSLMTLAACSSTSETEEAATGAQTSTATGSSSSSGSAQSSGASSRGQLTQEEIRTQAALEQTTFYFDFDVAEFQQEDRQALVYHARDLASNPNRRVRLQGHADERGTREYNIALGERRANNIMNFLIVNGASRSQLETVSYGEERPAVNGSTETAYARNRRVEIVTR
ncbi:MAG: peptidoglycan-associated lipoprotein Pal [Pseudohongiellaceae bacterium]